jgi:hypothetical protein
MIGRCFAGGIGTIGPIGSELSERRIFQAERAIDLVRGNMEKARLFDSR